MLVCNTYTNWDLGMKIYTNGDLGMKIYTNGDFGMKIYTNCDFGMKIFHLPTLILTLHITKHALLTFIS
jgi:hypothetical protein